MASPRLLIRAALLAATTVVVPTAAQASVLGSLGTSVATLATASDARCVDGPATKPFAPWSDRADYVTAPGGSFERRTHADWTLSRGASITAGNEPWHVSGDDADASALLLQTGASAASPDFCGGIDHPAVRLFARSATRGTSTALVTVRYTGSGDHLLAALPLGVITAGPNWSPTTVTATLSGLRLLTGAHLGVTVTSLTGSVLLDDVYVDPYRRS